ncbi:hypothetical protein PMAYCL1PPCAC_03611 [Pristionchus mayeri]|uniref:Uncharacterized protein n=1 Tax=Pristionchus mayeri TaxID=1317129 RepID=A0AAN4Z6G6_9BILA|nr:hypothetical protein PMAYCL1PPCAC_03611 [Pristionchus mayeri]
MEDNPWRHGEQPPMGWPAMAGGAGAQQWAHHSPQAGGPGRRGQNLWDANALADNLGELGLSGPPGAGGAPAWAPGGQPGGGGDFQNKTIWSDPHMGGAPEHSMHHAHMQYPQGGVMNGMMDPNAMPGAEWGMRGEQPMWSDPLKPDEGYWKGQGGGQGAPQWGGAQGAPPRWPPQMGGPPHHRGAPGMIPVAGGGWPGGAPNGMMGGGGHKPPMWDNGGGGGGHRMGGGGGMGGRGGGHRGNYNPRHGGMDMSVPPPMDMGMMQRPPPGGGGHMWKPDGGMGGPNGMRGGGGGGHGGYGGGPGQMGGGAPMGNFMGGGGKQQMRLLQMGDQFVGQFEDESKMFSMGGNGGGGQQSDDLMWHDRTAS